MMDNKKLPTRKSQRIPGYDYGTEGAYFITLCTNNFEKLLGEVNFEGNAVVELNEIGGVCKSILEGIDETAIYIIMPNHIHAIFEIYDKKTTIPKIITKFKSIVTRKVGKSIWQRSYFDRIIRNEKEYGTIWHYIEHNAERWRDDEFFRE